MLAMKLFGWLLFACFLPSTTPNYTYCKELKMHNLINCSGLALSAVPQFAKADWVHVLDLRSNDIRHMSAKELLAFSNLNTVDVRGNPCLDCESLQGIRERLSVLSYCLLNDEPSMKPVQDSRSFISSTSRRTNQTRSQGSCNETTNRPPYKFQATKSVQRLSSVKPSLTITKLPSSNLLRTTVSGRYYGKSDELTPLIVIGVIFFILLSLLIRFIVTKFKLFQRKTNVTQAAKTNSVNEPGTEESNGNDVQLNTVSLGSETK